MTLLEFGLVTEGGKLDIEDEGRDFDLPREPTSGTLGFELFAFKDEAGGRDLDLPITSGKSGLDRDFERTGGFGADLAGV